jgi:hypothetical protein
MLLHLTTTFICQIYERVFLNKPPEFAKKSRVKAGGLHQNQVNVISLLLASERSEPDSSLSAI